MGGKLVSQAMNLGILYVLYIVGKYAYTQQFVNKKPIKLGENMESVQSVSRSPTDKTNRIFNFLFKAPFSPGGAKYREW